MDNTSFVKFIVLIVGLLLISSCENAENAVQNANFDLQKPFGFTWESTDKYSDNLGEECADLVGSLKSLLSTTEYERALLHCRAEHYGKVYVPSVDIPALFQNGEISITFFGDEPILYNYAFLHDWNLNDQSAHKSKLRKSHAAAIKTKLIKLYGQPISNGYYDGRLLGGFVIDDEVIQTCNFWIKQNIGILLCPERPINVDGIEMALSIIRLDREAIGRELHSRILTPNGANIPRHDTQKTNSKTEV